ncbi:hypothetical protein AB6A40_010765 [Gnathostoma spinigerum]|uniref:Uncharacterized protein n=1 Tax=Gnathostoma spinigerum TaxID=75299 RepID=A0ABD6F1S7_9BILA
MTLNEVAIESVTSTRVGLHRNRHTTVNIGALVKPIENCFLKIGTTDLKTDTFPVVQQVWTSQQLKREEDMF